MGNGSDIAAGRLAGGEERRSFELFLQEHRVAVLNFLRSRVPCEADAQDATQESFIRLMRYAEAQPPSAWKPLLFRIAINVAHDQARMSATRQGTGLVPLDSEELVSDEPPQEQLVSQQQELAMIHKVIMRLPPKCRQVYLLHRLRGLSYAEIATYCGISRKTVEQHMARAFTDLREARQRRLEG
ncbi:RNA polymerase sigma factor [Flagellatimonas centrodinii]|uniref:RNA polymerase sigma factor n=1 Tax=Flagellatimonas centrodinii TaxID=2806210 RepID=UPI001FF014DF|nr:RNA polymerase sigma factor [Flagellatimonas centrodinii]ULQ46915.1 RNA polymerase sigma factor [Flagellatimonas centrodinii]